MKRLLKIAQQWKSEEDSKVHLKILPEPWGVLFVEPRKDEEGRKCSNCMFWVTDNSCVIHAPDVETKASDICGYHVNGKPIETRKIEATEYVNPKLSGLGPAPKEGTMCGNCKFYKGDKKEGVCQAVQDGKGNLAKVFFNSCCARWEEK